MKEKKTKICNQCKVAKPLSAFNVYANGNPRGACKECKKKKAQATNAEFVKMMLDVFKNVDIEWDKI